MPDARLESTVVQWKRHPEKPVRIVAFGSSNTELHWHSEGRFNWHAWLKCALREWVGRHVTLVDAGICGETVTDLHRRLDRDVLSFQPDLVIITIGGNDAMQGMPVETYREKLDTLVNILKSKGIPPVLQTYYCPLYEVMGEVFQMFPQFVEVNRELAHVYGIPLLDQYKYFYPYYRDDRTNYAPLMKDPLHMTPLGNALMGLIACRHFSLPDPLFPRDLKSILRSHMKRLKSLVSLPKRSRVLSRWKG